MMGKGEIELTVRTRTLADGRTVSGVEASVSEESPELARAAGDAAAELSRRIVEHDLSTLRSLPKKNG